MDTVGGKTTNEGMTRVLVVDAPLVRSALRLMLGGHDDVDVIGRAAGPATVTRH